MVWKRGWGDVGGEPYNPPVTCGDIPLFKGDEGLLRPVGHLLWERRLRANDVRPYGGWGFGVGEVERLWKKGGWWFNGLEKGVGRCGGRVRRNPSVCS